MSQSYSNEVRDGIIDHLQALLDIVGYHFVWCPNYRNDNSAKCSCGMAQMMWAKAKLNAEGQEEFNLWQDALE